MDAIVDSRNKLVDKKDNKDQTPPGNFLKNASCTENYHEKYYYPQVALERISQRNRQEAGDFSAEPITSLKGGSYWAGSSADTFQVNTNKKTNRGLQENAATYQQSQPVFFLETVQDMASIDGIIKEDTLPEARTMLSANSVPKSSDSVTSDDSVFSEDYTAMTDAGDAYCANDLGEGHISRAEPSDVDSSFSSPGSSTSTLEADGKEDGGNVEVVGPKDKVMVSLAGCTPPIHRKTRPDVPLTIKSVDLDVEGEISPLPSPELEEGKSMASSDMDTGGGSNKREDSGGHPTTVSHSTSFYEDREFDFLQTEPVRRSTSLKTYKTPPGTPSRKKAVRFADALGLDLESVRHILNLEEPPDVPKSAMNDLRVGLEEERPTEGVKYLSALFSQPGIDPGFPARVQTGKVVLENCVVDDKEMTLSGTVRVANVAFHKKVFIRYTTNNWLTSDDIVCSYVQNSNNGVTDRFSFTLTVPTFFSVGQRLEFALMFNAGGATYWDNNYGKNYAVECYAKALPTSESDNTWMHFL